MAQVRAKIRERTDRSHAGLPLGAVVDNLNPALRGWGAYFRYGNSAAKFDQIDAYVHQRLAMLASTKHGLRGWNWTTRFTRLGDQPRRPPPRRNGATHDCVCQPVNDVGEPCAGEPHARFDAAAGDGAVPLANGPKGRHASRRPYMQE
jgi:hypothetical protein